MKQRREPQFRLRDILRAADAILGNKVQSRNALAQDEMLFAWVVRHIEVIGEAAAHVPDQIKVAHGEIDWGAMQGMRNQLIHAYFDIDIDVIWEVVDRDLPILRKQIVVLLDELDREESTE